MPGNSLDVFPHPVSGHDEIEVSIAKAPGDRFHESSLLQTAAAGRSLGVDRIFPGIPSVRFEVCGEICVAPAPKQCGIFQDLGSDLPARLGIAPEFAFNQHQAAARSHGKQIEEHASEAEGSPNSRATGITSPAAGSISSIGRTAGFLKIRSCSHFFRIGRPGNVALQKAGRLAQPVKEDRFHDFTGALIYGSGTG